ncbi:hypothetical protein [Cellulosilyticum sp. I15G10I2]|uniref:hypothetical protein n=1 Tax=Cellulosilyticum sp. I15G10I2 TaxID=1892843 RepID=UPI00085C803F|nr:hypothetical protein [Cellulosilyticum sp. I15G10I2]
MRKIIYLSLIVFAFFTLGSIPLSADTLSGEYTFFTKIIGYTSAKYEPHVGTFTGAYVLQDSFIEN